MCTVFVNFAYWNSVLVWLHSLCCILFSSFRSCRSALLFVQFTRLCLFTRLFPVAPLLNPLLLIFGIFAFALSFVGRVVLPRILISAALRTYFRPLSWRKLWGVYSACLVFFLLFTRVLEKLWLWLCILRSGIKGTPILVALALVLLLPNRLLLIIAPILCAFSFGVSWVVGAVLIFVLSLVQLVVRSRISVPLMLLYFSSPNHRLSALARNPKLTLLRHHHCCTFCRCSSFIRFTQLAIRSWVFCRCFAYKVGFALLLLHSNCVPQLSILLLCVLCLAICLCASPNLVGMLSLTGSLLFGLCLLSMLISSWCTFSPSAISFWSCHRRSWYRNELSFWFRNIFSRYRFAGE